MNDIACLYWIAYQNNIDVDLFPMNEAESFSIPLNDGSCAIAIDPLKIRSTQDEKLKLAHEIGHCLTGSFYNKYSLLDIRQKHENRADRWAIKKLIPVNELKNAINNGYTEAWQLAEYFSVPQDFIEKAIILYRDRLGFLT